MRASSGRRCAGASVSDCASTRATCAPSAAAASVKNRAWGDKPVIAHGPKGTIEASGFRVEDKGQTIIFTGKAKVLLRLDEQDMKDMGGTRKAAKDRPASHPAGPQSAGPGAGE